MITMVIRWYTRKPDFSPDWNEFHQGKIKGTSPDDCMKQYRKMQNNHDLAKYTRLEIIGIY